MEASASYARQSEDETLLKAAMRIKARAIERCGELLREIPPARGGDRRSEDFKGAVADTSGRFSAARDAGLSRRQTVTALRVANVPKAEFEALVESADPPTVEALAQLGKQSRPGPLDYLGGRNPADFEQATRLIGLARYIRETTAKINLAAAVRGLHDDEKIELNEQMPAGDTNKFTQKYTSRCRLDRHV